MCNRLRYLTFFVLFIPGLVYAQWELEPRPISTAEVMDPITLLKETPPSQRCDWYRGKLAPYADFVNDAANYEGIPARLLATVVLNELGDIKYSDALQDLQLYGTNCNYGNYLENPILNFKPLGEQSFGIAQITPRTALRYNAVRLPEGAHERASPEVLDFYVACRLLDRPTSIYAAARIIRGILYKLEENTYRPWVQHFLNPGSTFSADQPYAYLHPPTTHGAGHTPTNTAVREMNLANLVASVYNSESILRMSDRELKDGRYYPDGRKHGDNARGIADDLYGMQSCNMPLTDWQHATPMQEDDPLWSSIEPESGWYVWVAKFGSGGRIHVGDQQEFTADKKYNDEWLAGVSQEVMKKDKIGGPFETKEQARQHARSLISKPRYKRSLGWGQVPVADYNGGQYYIDDDLTSFIQ